MRNRGAALYRDVIFSRVWGGEPDSECLRIVDTHIAGCAKAWLDDRTARDDLPGRLPP